MSGDVPLFDTSPARMSGFVYLYLNPQSNLLKTAIIYDEAEVALISTVNPRNCIPIALIDRETGGVTDLRMAERSIAGLMR